MNPNSPEPISPREPSQPPAASSTASDPTPITKSSDQKLAEFIVPINRSGWAIAAGYVALFTIPIIFVGPLAVILGILGLRSIHTHPQKIGKGRCWFAIVYGSLGTLLLAWVCMRILTTH